MENSLRLIHGLIDGPLDMLIASFFLLYPAHLPSDSLTGRTNLA